jgi:predicted Zn-dependent protease with MMP-like domain
LKEPPIVLNQPTRDRFDRELERVLDAMPELVHQLLEKVPLHVEDYPPDDVLREQGIEDPEELCGLFTGVPLTEQSMALSGTPPEVVTLYRLGLLAAAEDDDGRIAKRRLREEIRITILHELAHYHGLTEDELDQLGYG